MINNDNKTKNFMNYLIKENVSFSKQRYKYDQNYIRSEI